jgi:response regulator NasT
MTRPADAPSSDADTDRVVRVLLADEDRQALEAAAPMLDELGYEVLCRAVSLAEVSDAIREDDPDIALVVLHEDVEHALDLIEEIVDTADCPVVSLLEVEAEEFVKEAAKKGVYGYIRPLTVETLTGTIEVALRRHAEARSLAETVEQLKGAIQRRAIIERAKGILMERHGQSEREAFELLREEARRSRRRVVELAQHVVDGHALLRRRD